MMHRPLETAAFAAFVALFAAPTPLQSQDAAAPRLEVPLACPGGRCVIQQYFDHDSGPDARDHTCGTKSYDGHDGVDFRVPSRAVMLSGVLVRAAAGGTVRNIRDGVPDHPGTLADLLAAQGRECGNGVVVVHPGGWETQYCHMKSGSIRVRPGQTVASGDMLGQVGQSGKAQFPHLHLGVRQGTRKVDPFADAATPLACGKAGRSLWSPAAAAALAYRSPEVLNAGFAPGPVSMEAVEGGAVTPPTTTSPALVAYVRAIGLEAGDAQTLELAGPRGQSAKSDGPTLARPRAQHLMFTGDRGSPARGAYRARYTVKRKGRVVLEHRFELTL